MAAASSEMSSGLDRRLMPAVAASNTGTLPPDSIYEILLRLPVMDLYRLRAVCRPWWALLSDPHFAVAHARRQPGSLLIAAYTRESDSLVEIMDLSGHRLKKVPRRSGNYVVSMSKDLVHVSKSIRGSYNSRLLNPATGAMYYLRDMNAEGASYLFGHSAKGEHKVLRRFDKIGSEQLIEVFTLNNGACAMWREKPAPPRRLACDKLTDVVIDGVAYILCGEAFGELNAYRRVNVNGMIITFDLEAEEWGTILGPNISFLDLNLAFPYPCRLTLADLNGSLAVVCGYGPVQNMDIWISKDIAKGDWVKQYSITFRQIFKLNCAHPVLVLDDQRLLMYTEHHELLQIYNPRRNIFTNVSTLTHCSSVSLYTGKLLSLEC